MKFLVIAVAFCMFVSAQALTDAQREQGRTYSKECISDTSVDMDFITRMRGGDMEFSDEKMFHYIFCMFRKMNLMSEDGTFNKSAALDLVSDDVKDEVTKAIDICVKEGGATKEERAFNYLKCYYKQRPNHDIKL